MAVNRWVVSSNLDRPSVLRSVVWDAKFMNGLSGLGRYKLGTTKRGEITLLVP